MFGVVNGVYLCNLDRTSQLSNRIAERNVPSSPLQPSFSIRPVSTKYALLPVLDRRAPATVPIKQEAPYSVDNVFNPGTATAPWSGFADHVNVESSLRRQFFALQKCEQSEYVPSTASDMYTVNVQSSKPVEQPFPGLFRRYMASQPDEHNTHPKSTESQSVFDNHTRQQRMNGQCIYNSLKNK